eukprot:1857378-Prymnesium_polylepis.2
MQLEPAQTLHRIACKLHVQATPHSGLRTPGVCNPAQKYTTPHLLCTWTIRSAGGSRRSRSTSWTYKVAAVGVLVLVRAHLYA